MMDRSAKMVLLAREEKQRSPDLFEEIGLFLHLPKQTYAKREDDWPKDLLPFPANKPVPQKGPSMSSSFSSSPTSSTPSSLSSSSVCIDDRDKDFDPQ